MAKFRLVFKNRLGVDGEPIDLPADKVNANGAMIEFYGFADRETRKGEAFSRDTWDYEVRDQDAARFEEGLKTTPNLIEYKSV